MNINSGDKVRITARGLIVTGIVQSAWADMGLWNINLTDERGNPRSWKQRYDGGTVEKVAK